MYRAIRSIREDGKRKTQLMHRVVAKRMGVDAPTVDHINKNTLDNRRENLRGATYSQNGHNCKKPSTNTSGYIGVVRSAGKWMGQVKHEGRHHSAGRFDDPAVASAARNQKKRELAGEFAPNELKSTEQERVDLALLATPRYEKTSEDTRREKLIRPPRNDLKGIYQHRGRSRTQITAYGMVIPFGSYDTPEEAANVHDEAMREWWGPPAYLNFPTEADLALGFIGPK